MFGFMKMLGLVIDALPAVVKMIDVAEAVVGPGNGATKLAMVKNTVQTAYAVSNDVESSFDSIWPVFESSIGHIVAANKQIVKVEPDPAPNIPDDNPAEHPYAPVALNPSIVL